MPFKCCVTGCKSNYNANEGYVSVFRFPDKSRNLWIRKIPRANLEVTNNTRICIRHFDERFIIRNFQYVGPDGLPRSEPRDVPILTDDAFPSIFPELPQYLSEKVPAQRKDPEKRRMEIDQRDDAVVDRFL